VRRTPIRWITGPLEVPAGSARTGYEALHARYIRPAKATDARRRTLEPPAKSLLEWLAAHPGGVAVDGVATSAAALADVYGYLADRAPTRARRGERDQARPPRDAAGVPAARSRRRARPDDCGDLSPLRRGADPRVAANDFDDLGNADAREAERRVAYVAFTRAQQRLVVLTTTGSASRFCIEAVLVGAPPPRPAPVQQAPAGAPRSRVRERAPKGAITGYELARRAIRTPAPIRARSSAPASRSPRHDASWPRR
jgi:hypothetical protein